MGPPPGGLNRNYENNMNAGPGRPSGGGGRNRRRRGRRPRGSNPGGGRPGRDQQHGGGGIYTAPMDHSYRAAMGGGNNGSRPGRQRPGFSPNYPQPEPDPLPMPEDATSRLFSFADELFCQA